MIGIIGDLHLKENLSYADYIKDRRISEKKEILDFIVDSLKDCDKIVFLGDQFDKRSNPSNVVREFTEFLERFSGKDVYMISGNHCKYGTGETAIDYLKEIKNDKWHIITRTPTKIDEMVFVPYMTNAELGAKDNEEALKTIMELIMMTKGKEKGKILFHHNAVYDTVVNSGRSVNDFPEPILPAKELEKEFDLIVGGHIHKPQIKGKKILVAGSIFNNEVGEIGKKIFKIDEKTLEIETIDLPGRKIYKLEDPTEKEIEDIENNSIVKVILTKKKTSIDLTKFKESLKRFDAYILLEQIPKTKKKMHYGKDESILEFSVENLLGVYAKDKKIDEKKVLKGFELIKD
jgi:DNA repair exonuclease SbcCD nuclease subunit